MNQKIIEATPLTGAAREGKPDTTLRVGVHNERVPTTSREGMREVDADGGFSDSSFLAGCGYGDHGLDVSQGSADCMKNDARNAIFIAPSDFACRELVGSGADP